METEWMRFVIKCCSVAALVLLVIVALSPVRWQPRTGLGWEIQHFVGYTFTLMFCLAWPRPPRLRTNAHIPNRANQSVRDGSLETSSSNAFHS